MNQISNFIKSTLMFLIFVILMTGVAMAQNVFSPESVGMLVEKYPDVQMSEAEWIEMLRSDLPEFVFTQYFISAYKESLNGEWVPTYLDKDLISLGTNEKDVYIRAGDILIISGSITNIGTRRASKSEGGGETNCGEGAITLSAQMPILDNLDRGESGAFYLICKYPKGGDYLTKLTFDLNNNISEFSKINNTFSANVDVMPQGTQIFYSPKYILGIFSIVVVVLLFLIFKLARRIKRLKDQSQ